MKIRLKKAMEDITNIEDNEENISNGVEEKIK